MIDQKLLTILVCPKCYGSLSNITEQLICNTCRAKFSIIEGIPVFFDLTNESKNTLLVHEKWEEFYHSFDWEKELEIYSKNNTPYIMSHLKPIIKDNVFMEVGSGASFLCFTLAKMGMKVLMIDFDINILLLAKKYFDHHNVSGYFICANIQSLPVATNSIDVSAGIGVIEHTNTIEKSINELSRVTRNNGFTFQTVPALSITTLTYNQRYGTVPHLPILRSLFTWFHTKILGARHMKYGYEEAFTTSFLKKAFLNAGFADIQIDFYDYKQAIAKKIFGNLFRPLVSKRLFWDILYIKAYKKSKQKQ